MTALTVIAMLLAAAPGPKRAAPVAPVTDPGALRLLGAVVPLPDGVEAVPAPAAADRAAATLHTGPAVLLLTVYAGAGAPNRWTALSAHTEELVARVEGATVSEVQQPLFGRAITAREVRYTRAGSSWVARVVAAQKDRHTVVATWTWPAADGATAAATLAEVVAGVRVAKGR